MLFGMYPTEWALPKQDRDELMMLLGMSTMQREKRAHEQRLAEPEQTRLRGIVSSVGQFWQAEPTA